MKQTFRLTESELRNIISEVINELGTDVELDTYFGGGLPEPSFRTNSYTAEKEIIQIYNHMKPFVEELADIFNEWDCDNREVYDKAIAILDGIDMLPEIAKKFYRIEHEEVNNYDY